MSDLDDAGDESSATDNTTGKPPTKSRQGDQNRPTCPRCSLPKKPVKLVASSTRTLFTWYSCPNGCGHSVKLPRPNINQVLGKERRDNDDGEFAAR